MIAQPLMLFNLMEEAMTAHAMPSRDEIIALEKSYWDAMKAKDGNRTQDLSAQSSIVTNAGGVMRIAKDKMGKMTEEGDWSLDSYAFENIEVSTPSPDVALIAYTVHQTGKMSGKAYDKRAVDSSVWIRGLEGWECHAHSETFLN